MRQPIRIPEAGATAMATIDRLHGNRRSHRLYRALAEVEVVDEDENRLAPGAEGVLRIRSSCQAEPFPPGRVDGHAGFRNGSLYPGDRGRIEADGLLVLGSRTTTSSMWAAGDSRGRDRGDAGQRPAMLRVVAIGGSGPGWNRGDRGSVMVSPTGE